MPSPSLIARLKTLYTGGEESLPKLSSSTAVALLILYTLIYVLPFYLSRTTRPSPSLSRDAPSVISARIRFVTLSCAFCSLSTFFLIFYLSKPQHAFDVIFETVHQLGYWPVGVIPAFKVLLLTGILFLGPLFEAGIAEGRWRGWVKLEGVGQILGSWMGWRNFVAGPVTEEILFRSASVPLLLLAHTSTSTIIVYTPVIFGLAHIHHFYEFRITHPYTPLSLSILRTLLQLTYTSLFGGYATFLYLRTGSLVGVIVVHSFCNWMGFPRFWGKITAEENRDLGWRWTGAYYVFLVTGAVGWGKLLWVLTESESALTTF